MDLQVIWLLHVYILIQIDYSLYQIVYSLYQNASGIFIWFLTFWGTFLGLYTGVGLHVRVWLC